MLDFNNFITALQERISKPLPGMEAQMLMSPLTRSEYLKNLPDNYKIKKSK